MDTTDKIEPAPRRRVVVYHRGYGCDTGCCGHVVKMDGGPERFEFDHPLGDDPLQFARDLVEKTFGKEHVADLDWENCVIVDED